MPKMLAITLEGPVAAVRAIGTSTRVPAAMAESERRRGQPLSERMGATTEVAPERPAEELRKQQAHLDRLCQLVGSIVRELQEHRQEAVAGHRKEIARLAVEIARKILRHEISNGNYDIQAIVEEALKCAPTRQNMVIRVHPEDLAQCQQIQRGHPDGPFAELAFAADWSIGRGECVVETPKGIVKSFVEEHLERISERLQNVD